MATPFWIRQMLQRRGISFIELHHPVVYTAQELAEQEHVSGHRVAKVVVVMVGGRPFELVLPASRQVELNRVRTILGTRDVRLATEEEMERFFDDCEVGAVPPLRHWEGVEVLMDRSLNVEGDIVFQAGTHRDAIRVNFRDWYNMVNPQVASFSRPPALADL